MLVSQSWPTLCDPTDCSPPGSSVHGILQVRILEGVAISFSRGSFQPRDQTGVSCVSCNWQANSLPLSHLGGPSLTWQWCMKFHIFSENFTVKGEEENITREFHQDTKDISGSDYLWNFTSCWHTVLILTWNEIPILILYVLFLPSKMLIKWGIG